MLLNSKIIRFALGVITVIVLVFFYGVFSADLNVLEGFFQFALLSIICTAGVSLVIWIPAMYMIGTITAKILEKIFNIKPSKQTAPTSINPQNSISTPSTINELSIIGYIVSCRNAGNVNDDSIKLNLKSGGWSDLEIERAFNKCVPIKNNHER